MYVNARALIERMENGQRQLLVQVRHKPFEGRPRLELPGGRVEAFESLTDALRREVREETGLELTWIEGEQTRIETGGSEAAVECIRPFAAYQTLRGPVDSLGVYFRCQAAGVPVEAGDDSLQPRWMPIDEIARLLHEDAGQFSFVDRAGLIFYIQEHRPG